MEKIKELLELTSLLEISLKEIKKQTQEVAYTDPRDEVYWHLQSLIRKLTFSLAAANPELRALVSTEAKPFVRPLRDKNPLVSVRSCKDNHKAQHGDKTFLGLYIGDAALGAHVEIKGDEISCHLSQYNPAIYIPQLDEIIYGCECWWSTIHSEEDLTAISDQDIKDTWYVKLLANLYHQKQ